jgi:hypothetical protein
VQNQFLSKEQRRHEGFSGGTVQIYDKMQELFHLLVFPRGADLWKELSKLGVATRRALKACRLAHDCNIFAGRVRMAVLIWVTIAPYFCFRLQKS